MVDSEMFSSRLDALAGYLDRLRSLGETPEPDYLAEPGIQDLPAGIIVIPSIPRKPSSNVAMNSAPWRCAAATMAASAKLNRGRSPCRSCPPQAPIARSATVTW